MTPNPPSSPLPPPPVDRQEWVKQLQIPSIAICAIAALNLALFGIVAPMLVAEVITGRTFFTGSSEPPDPGAAASAIGLALLNLFVLFGGIQMMRLRSKGWAGFAAAAVILPCTGPCCVIGIPLGIWALVTINKIPREAWD